MRLSEKPHHVSYSKSQNKNKTPSSLLSSYYSKPCSESVSCANPTRHSHGLCQFHGEQPGSALEGGPEGEGGGVDEVLKNAALMVCQSRQPDVASAVGYSDGIHSPLNKQRAQHVCSETDSECKANWERLKVIDSVSNVNSPLVVEIWLYADSTPSFETKCCEVDLDDTSEADPVLIEVWTFQKILKRQSSDLANFVDANSLYQAIRSHLSFSQLASWLVKSNGKSPRNVHYKLCPGGDILSPSSKLPLQCFDFHKFPPCYPDRDSNYFVSTEVRFLKRDVHPKSSPRGVREFSCREDSSNDLEAVKPATKIGELSRKNSPDVVCGFLPQREECQSPCLCKNQTGQLFPDTGGDGSDYDSGTLQSRKKTRSKDKHRDGKSPRQKLYTKLMHSLGHADKNEEGENSDSSDCLVETMIFKTSIFDSSPERCSKKSNVGEDNKLIVSRMTHRSDSGESLVDESKSMDGLVSSQFVPTSNSSDVSFALSCQLPTVLAQKSGTAANDKRKLFTVGGSCGFSNDNFDDEADCDNGEGTWHVGVDIDSVFLDGVLTIDRTSELCDRTRSISDEEKGGGNRKEEDDEVNGGPHKIASHYGALLTSQPRNSSMSRDVVTTGLNFGATTSSTFADEKQNFCEFSNNQPHTSSITSAFKINQSQWTRKDQISVPTKCCEHELQVFNGFLGSNKSLDLHSDPQLFPGSANQMSPAPIWSPSDGNDPYSSLSDLLCGFENIAQSAPQPKIEHLKLMSSHTENKAEMCRTDPPKTKSDTELEPAVVKRALSYSNHNGMCFNANTGLPLSSSPIAFRRMSKSVSFHSKDALNGLIDSGDGQSANENMKGLDCVRGRTWSTSNRSLAGYSSASSSSSSQLSLVVNFEESVLNGRIEPFGVIEGFKADIGAAGGKFCPKHATISFAACYYNLSDDGSPSPYFGYISLESLGKRGYRVPRKGQVQVTLFNPNGSLIKIFIVMFDLSSMPPNHHTFLRQRTFLMPCSGSTSGRRDSYKAVTGTSAMKCQEKLTTPSSSNKKATLRYLLHLRFQSSSSGKIYLHTDIRCIFSRNQGYETTMDGSHGGNFQLKSFTEVPQNPQFSPCKSS